MRIQRTRIVLVYLALMGAACAQQASVGSGGGPAAAENPGGDPSPASTGILRDTFGIRTQSQIDVPLAEVLQGCPRRDCIPAIDAPRFLGATDPSAPDDDDLVMGIVRGDTARAYPLYILNFHEVVNDSIAGEPIAITYCPLCGSGLAFRRELDGKPVQLGVSGLLHNSDLILYDRATQSLWQQITGRAIAGPRRGQVLESVPVTVARWDEWRSAHPGTRVLSTDTGHQRDYTQKTPYGDYDRSEALMFPANQAAGLRLHPKQVVHGVELDQGSAAVTERALAGGKPVRMRAAGVELTWTRLVDGSVEVRRSGDSRRLLPQRMFWFAWYSFHTDTVLHDLPAAQRRNRKPGQ